MAGETFGLIAELVLAFPQSFKDTPRREIEARARLYERELGDLPPALLAAAARDLIRTEEWFPTVAKLRERVAERALELPDESGALSQVEERMRWGRSDESERAERAPGVHPLVREAVDHVGGFYAFREAQDATVLRGQFGRLYRELRARAVYEYQLDPLRPARSVS